VRVGAEALSCSPGCTVGGYWEDHVIIHLSKLTECTTPRMELNVTCGLQADNDPSIETNVSVCWQMLITGEAAHV
jgi:hypothetical protein